MAGPTARARLNPALLSATATGRSRRPTSSGTMACQAGALSADPRPSRKVSVSSPQSDIAPASVSAPSRHAVASIHAWVISSNRRRSITSASAPAGKPTRKTGRLVAVCSRATSTAEDVSEVISQAAPTLCIQVPTLDATEAIQSARNTGWASGLHGELGAELTVDVADLHQAKYRVRAVPPHSAIHGPQHGLAQFMRYPSYSAAIMAKGRLAGHCRGRYFAMIGTNNRQLASARHLPDRTMERIWRRLYDPVEVHRSVEIESAGPCCHPRPGRHAAVEPRLV